MGSRSAPRTVVLGSNAECGSWNTSCASHRSDRSSRPRRDEAAALGARLGAHLAKLTRMKVLLEDGMRAKEAAAKLGLKEFPG